MASVSAAVLVAPSTIELQQLPRPDIAPDEAIVRLEACGICGTDIDQFGGRPGQVYPIIPGHEPVGVIEEIGDVAAARRRLKAGDRVAVEPFIPCGNCRFCLTGTYEFCTGWAGPHVYGYTPVTQAPGIWGGYATHLYVHPKAILHPVPAHVNADLAVLYNPLGAGIKWGVDVPGTTIGSTVAVLGCGQRGMACVIATRAAGASLVVTTGLARDRHKLDLAKEFGADAAIDVEHEDAVARIRDMTGGLGVDIVIDTTPHATQPVVDALEIARPGGTIVLGGLKGGRPVPQFPVDRIVQKALTIRGVLGVSADPYRRAIELIASGRFPLEKLRSHVFPLDQAARAVQTLAEADPKERVMNIVIAP